MAGSGIGVGVGATGRAHVHEPEPVPVSVWTRHRYLFRFIAFVVLAASVSALVWYAVSLLRRRNRRRESQEGESSSAGWVAGLIVGLLFLFGYISYMLRARYGKRTKGALQLGISMPEIKRTITIFSGPTRNADSPFAAFFLPHYHLLGQTAEETEDIFSSSASYNITTTMYFFDVFASILDDAADAGKDVHVVGEEDTVSLKHHRTQPENKFTREEITDVFPRLMDLMGTYMRGQEVIEGRALEEFKQMLQEPGREDEAALLVKLARCAPSLFAEAYMKYMHPESKSKVKPIPYTRGYEEEMQKIALDRDKAFRDKFGVGAAQMVSLNSRFIATLEKFRDQDLSEENALLIAIRREKEERSLPQDFDESAVTVEDLKAVSRNVLEITRELREAVAMGVMEREVSRFPDDVHVLTFGSAHHAFEMKPLVADLGDKGGEVEFRLKVPAGMSDPRDWAGADEDLLDRAGLSLAERERMMDRARVARRAARRSLRGQRKTEDDFNRVVDRLIAINGSHSGISVDGELISYAMSYDGPGGKMERAIEKLKEFLYVDLEGIAHDVERVFLLREKGYTREMDRKVERLLSAGAGAGERR